MSYHPFKFTWLSWFWISQHSRHQPADGLVLSACVPDPSVFSPAPHLRFHIDLLCHLVASSYSLRDAGLPSFFPAVTILFGHMCNSLERPSINPSLPRFLQGAITSSGLSYSEVLSPVSCHAYHHMYRCTEPYCLVCLFSHQLTQEKFP